LPESDLLSLAPLGAKLFIGTRTRLGHVRPANVLKAIAGRIVLASNQYSVGRGKSIADWEQWPEDLIEFDGSSSEEIKVGAEQRRLRMRFIFRNKCGTEKGLLPYGTLLAARPIGAKQALAAEPCGDASFHPKAWSEAKRLSDDRARPFCLRTR